MDVVRIGSWFQGPTGSGQGGWTAHRFASAIGGDAALTFAIRAPVPLDRDLCIVADAGGGWRLVDDAPGTDGTDIMIAGRLATAFASTTAVDPALAATARERFADVVTEHPVPFCFSCGLQPDSMGVHAGPIPDDARGRFATDWRAPEWAVGDDGMVDAGVLWAALDCTAAWYVSYSREPRNPLTVQYAAEVVRPISPGVTYSLVGWSGDHPAEWDGRKRHAASAAFAPDATCVARAASFWIAVDG